MCAKHRQSRIGGILSNLGVVLVAIVVTTCVHGQGRGQRKQRPIQLLTARTATTLISASGKFNFTEVELLRKRGADSKLFDALEQLGYVTDKGLFTDKGNAANFEPTLVGGEGWNIPVATHDLVRVTRIGTAQADGRIPVE